MIQNFRVRRHDIKFKVFTEPSIENLCQIFQEELAKAKLGLPADQEIELLFNIVFEKEMFSGDSGKDVIDLFKKHKKAKCFNITLKKYKKDPPENPGIFTVYLTVSREAPANNYLEVYGLDETWVNGVFKKIEEVIESFPGRNKYIRHPITDVLVQLSAVLGVSSLSIFSAEFFSHRIAGIYIPLYAFTISFLVTSNLWNYISQWLIQLRNNLYPQVDIREAPRTRIFSWLVSFFFAGVASWAIGYVLDKFVNLFG